jgi:hypothetical protein
MSVCQSYANSLPLYSQRPPCMLQSDTSPGVNPPTVAAAASPAAASAAAAASTAAAACCRLQHRAGCWITCRTQKALCTEIWPALSLTRLTASWRLALRRRCDRSLSCCPRSARQCCSVRLRPQRYRVPPHLPPPPNTCCLLLLLPLHRLSRLILLQFC